MFLLLPVLTKAVDDKKFNWFLSAFLSSFSLLSLIIIKIFHYSYIQLLVYSRKHFSGKKVRIVHDVILAFVLRLSRQSDTDMIMSLRLFFDDNEYLSFHNTYFCPEKCFRKYKTGSCLLTERIRYPASDQNIEFSYYSDDKSHFIHQ